MSHDDRTDSLNEWERNKGQRMERDKGRKRSRKQRKRMRD
jgi:hypothetical protein